jgi:hypothetical protein
MNKANKVNLQLAIIRQTKKIERTEQNLKKDREKLAKLKLRLETALSGPLSVMTKIQEEQFNARVEADLAKRGKRDEPQN